MIKILIKINSFLDRVIWKHINKLRNKRLNWVTYQNKGQLLPSIQNIGFLAQEESFINNKDETDYYLILQEDGSAIYVTALI